MDLCSEIVEGAAVLNVANVCAGGDSECRGCIDIGGAVHNWLMTTGIRYVIVDLQDEKDLCPGFLVELLQLKKRLRIPFLFCGVMERPLVTLEAYNFFVEGTPTFFTPEEAVDYLRTNHAAVVEEGHLLDAKAGEQIVSFRARQTQRLADGSATEDGGAEATDF